MHLKSLTVRGFKSFASATVFEFQPGLNAIVGPNGSGKSNVVDALTWVLGAQGASVLRGGAMKDVIFAGGADRTALGRARVELVIDNSDGSLPLPYTEISLARTMFSAGGSEYEINGSSARLTDVQELLSDAGLGRELHSLVGQGQLDKILHGSAGDRRDLLEEAAGLNKYRKRQSKTAGRLEAMKGNLDRLEDMAGELGQQLEGRREQADTARSASAVAARVRSLTGDLLALEAREVQDQLERDTAATDRTRQVQQEAEERLGELTGRQEELEKREKRAVAERDRARTLLTRAESLHHRASSVALVAGERAADREPAGARDTQSRLEAARAAVGAEEAEALRLEAALAEQKEALKLARAEAESSAAAVTALAEEVTAQERTRSLHREKVAELTGELAVARAGFERAQTELEDRETELADFVQVSGGAVSELETARSEVEELTTELTGLEKDEKHARSARQDAARKEAESRGALHQAELEVESLTARREALEAAARHDIGGGEDTSAVEVARASGAQELASLLKIEPGWEKAVSAALGQLENAFTRQDLSQPQGVSAVFRTAGTPATGATKDKALAKVLSRSGVFSLTDLVTAPADLLDLLSDTLGALAFCESENLAQELAPEAAGIRLVSRSGTLHTATSLIYPAHGSGAVEIFAELTAAGEQLETARAEHSRARTAAQVAQETHEGAQAAEKALARTIGARRAALAKATAQLARVEARTETAGTETRRLQERATRAKTALAEAGDSLSTATSALDTLLAEKPAEDQQQKSKSLALARETAADRAQKLTLASAQTVHLEESFRAAQARCSQAQAAYDALVKAGQKAKQQDQEREERRRRAKATARSASALLAAIEGSIEEQRGELTACEGSLVSTRKELADVREEAAGAQKSLAAALTLRAEGAAGRARLEARWEALETRTQDTLGQGLSALLESREPASGLDGAEQAERTREELESALAAAEKELKHLGVVNPLALEEFEALKQRHDYLQGQIRDLKKSRADLRAVMKDVSEHIEKSFRATFEQVQGEFSRIFAELFPGGEGKLVLSDPADAQNSGIDLHVRPAGKKVTRLSLLSGGERSLASLALLLAVFMARPAPFYVLDEVEAALDDRNLGRLLGVLERLREVSQLIMVTHHQRTMGSADTLYGISMRDGVSKVISQRAAHLGTGETEEV